MISSNNKSGYTGVCKIKDGGWEAYYCVNGKHYYKYGFKSPKEAHNYRCELVRQHKNKAIRKWSKDLVLEATKTCQTCGDTFKCHPQCPEKKQEKRKFCSTACALFNPNSWKQKGSKERKACTNCGKVFGPWIGKDGSMQGEKAWLKQDCCTQSCAKKLKNPMYSDEVRERARNSLLLSGHQPKIRGGNGRPLPVPQKKLLEALGSAWKSEVVVCTKMGRYSGYPSCYKIDIGNMDNKIGIEVDGGSHQSRERQSQDIKKVQFLKGLGWNILRITNSRALELCNQGLSEKDILKEIGDS